MNPRARFCKRLVTIGFLFSWISAGAVAVLAEEVESPTVTASWAELVARDAEIRALEAGQEPAARPFMPIPASGSPRAFRARTLEGRRAETDRDAALGARGVAHPQLQRNFQALLDNNTVIPPDTIGAVGPNHVMTTLNSEVRIQTKDGTILNTVSLSAFWSPLGQGQGPFDPKIVYDPTCERWIAVCDARGNSSSSKVFVALSNTDDPTGTWKFTQFAADSFGAYWADYPLVGFNKNWIAITNNMFTVNANPQFGGAKMWVINKPASVSGASIVLSRAFPREFDITGEWDGYPVTSFTLKPCETYDPNDETLYIVDNIGWADGDPNDPNTWVPVLRITQLTGAISDPQFAGVPGSQFGTGETGLFRVANKFWWLQIDAAQLGSANGVSTNDYRIFSAMFRDGRMWFTHTGGLPMLGPPDRTASFWYELNPAAMPSPLVQSGKLDGGPGEHYFFPAIAVNSRREACLGFSHSNGGIYVEAAFTGRAADDPLGTMQAVQTLKAGEAPYYKTYGGSSNRWGDYSATVVDPVDGTTFWTIQEYAATPGGGADRWGTWWGEITFISDCNLNGIPDECDIDCNTPGCDPNLPCGTSADCNANLIPDECEAGTLGPTISVQPTAVTACRGTSATFQVTASGTPPVTYQWQKDGVDIAGATSNTYAIAAATPADGGAYRVVVRDNCSHDADLNTIETSSEAALTVQPETLITTHPQSQTVPAGTTVTFSVAATGPGTLAYQWRKDGVNIFGAIFQTYAVPAVVGTDAANYDVVVTSVCTSATSSAATLQVTLPSPNALFPLDDAVDVSIDADIKWAGVYGAENYDVFFGTDAAPPLAKNTASTTYTLPALAYSTTYYWRIVARAGAAFSTGPVWSFTTHPGPPTAPAGPVPADGAAGVDLTSPLSWGGADGATIYKLVFGKDATLKDATFAGATLTKSWVALPLEPGTTYYWRVIAKSEWGETAGPVWSFTTRTSAGDPGTTPTETPGESPVQPPVSPPVTPPPDSEPDGGAQAEQDSPSPLSALCPTTGAALVSATLLATLTARPRRRR